MEVIPVGARSKMDVNRMVKYMKDFTEVYLQHQDSPVAVREAAILKVQYPFIMGDIEEGDLFAGRLHWPALSFTPQADGNEGGFGYVFNFSKTALLLEDSSLTSSNRQLLLELREFWKNHHSSFKTRQAYPPHIKEGLPGDNWTGESGVAFPLYRIAGTHLNYKKLVQKGIGGLEEEIATRKQHTTSEEKKIFYQSCLDALGCFRDVCLYYEAQAWEKSRKASSAERKRELEEMAVSLGHIASDKPATLREAIQLTFLYCLVSGSQNYGRIDDYLGDFLEEDLNHGVLTRESALKLFEGYWRIMIARMAPYDGRAIVGGRGRSNEPAADRLALLAIETAGRVMDILPQLTLRFYRGQNPLLYQRALDVLGKGSTFPMLYNDEVNIPSVQKAMEVPYEEAVDYLPFGCGEYVLYHKSIATPSSVLNLLKCLEVTLHKGIDPLTGKRTGIDLGGVEFRSFDDLWSAYAKNLEYFIDILAEQEEIEYKVAAKEADYLLLGILFDDCLERGKGILNGGARYLGGTMETYGNVNTADSFTAIRYMVYDQQKISLEELVHAMDKDFEGDSQLHRQLLNLPKFGNDEEEADEMARRVHEHVCLYTRNQPNRTGLHHYLVVNINNDANTTLGRFTCASADGRKAFTSMANGNSPMMGMDKKGITAMFNSMLKMDTSIHAGAVQNVKFSKEIFSKYRSKLEALLESYFNHGGAQLMLTVVGKDDLQKAMEHPEQYQHIIVRVGGFSARFVELNKAVQKEILTRTLYA